MLYFNTNVGATLDRPGAVKGARFARRSEPLTARTDLESYEGEGKGIPQPSSHLPTKNPEYPYISTKESLYANHC